jgi:hypothetical protein
MRRELKLKEDDGVFSLFFGARPSSNGLRIPPENNDPPRRGLSSGMIPPASSLVLDFVKKRPMPTKKKVFPINLEGVPRKTVYAYASAASFCSVVSTPRKMFQSVFATSMLAGKI